MEGTETKLDNNETPELKIEDAKSEYPEYINKAMEESPEDSGRKKQLKKQFKENYTSLDDDARDVFNEFFLLQFKGEIITPTVIKVLKGLRNDNEGEVYNLTILKIIELIKIGKAPQLNQAFLLQETIKKILAIEKDKLANPNKYKRDTAQDKYEPARAPFLGRSHKKPGHA